jgi:hypothetical protein
MNPGSTGARSGAPVPPAVTRTAGTAPLPGAIRPPFLPGGGQGTAGAGHTRWNEAVPASPPAAAADTDSASSEAAAMSLPAADDRGESRAAEPPPPGGELLLSREEWDLLPEDGAALPAWGDEDPVGDGDDAEEADGPAGDFPLDAFFVPVDARSPSGYHSEADAAAERLAARLEELARAIREHGIAALGAGADADALTRAVAAAVLPAGEAT